MEVLSRITAKCRLLCFLGYLGLVEVFFLARSRYELSFWLTFGVFILRVQIMALTKVKPLYLQFLPLLMVIWMSRIGASDTVRNLSETDFYLACCLMLYYCFAVSTGNQLNVVPLLRNYVMKFPLAML